MNLTYSSHPQATVRPTTDPSPSLPATSSQSSNSSIPSPAPSHSSSSSTPPQMGTPIPGVINPINSQQNNHDKLIDNPSTSVVHPPPPVSLTNNPSNTNNNIIDINNNIVINSNTNNTSNIDNNNNNNNNNNIPVSQPSLPNTNIDPNPNDTVITEGLWNHHLLPPPISQHGNHPTIHKATTTPIPTTTPTTNTTSNKNNNGTTVKFKDNAENRIQSMPSSSRQTRHRASFSGFNVRSGLSKPIRGVSALGALISPSSATAHNNGTSTVDAILNSKSKSPKRPDIRPFHQKTTGTTSPSLRSKSFGAINSSFARTYPFAEGASVETSSVESSSYLDSQVSESNSNNGQSYTSSADGSKQGDFGNHQSRGGGLRRNSLSRGKSGKKALKMRFRKLRRRKGSRESDDSLRDPSSESEQDDGYQGTRLAQKFATGLPTTTTTNTARILLSSDPPLPSPPLPLPSQKIKTNPSQSREISAVPIPTYAMSYGFGAATGYVPLSAVTKGSTSIPGIPGVAISSSSGQTSAAPSAPPTPSGEPNKESSTTRFKEMIKRNVGLSSTSSAVTPAAASMFTSTATSPSGVSGKSNYQPWSAIGDLLSGDDQSSSKFSVSRLTGRKKRKKARGPGPGPVGTGIEAGFVGLARTPTGTILDEDDDSQAVYTAMKENPHQYHFRTFLPYMRSPPKRNKGSYAYQSLDPVLEELLGGSEFNLKNRRKQCALISRALAEARKSNKDPNVLVVEVKPIPVGFVNAFTANTASPTPAALTTSPADSSAIAPRTASVPTLSTMPSSTATTSGVFATGGAKFNNNQQLPIMGGMAPSASMPSTITALNGSLLLVPVYPPMPSTPPSNVTPAPKPVKLSLPDKSALDPRPFLLKSYQHSRFHGYYVFRIRGDYIEYRKLPATFDYACSEYFHEADKTYRILDEKAQLWYEEKRVALDKREQEFEEVRQTHIAFFDGSAKTTTREISEASGGEESDYDQDNIIRKRQLLQRLQLPSGETEYFTRDGDDSSTYSMSDDGGSDSSNATTPTTSYFSGASERKLIDSDNSLCSVEDSENGSSCSTRVEVLESNCGDNYFQPKPQLQPRIQSLAVPDMAGIKAMRRKGKIWDPQTNIMEHEKYEQLQRSIDNAYWQKVERNYCEESRQQLYGLNLYLETLTRNIEYERYEKTNDVEILKSNTINS
ncbi:hypothetical protein BGZ46_009761 [Entomortierella lignicola]|nr:hypothetical protein BGZ46_009761 [Entomortierella lignicola]